MKPHNLIAAIIVLGALAGTLYWSEHRKPAEDTTKAAETSPAILKLDESAITKVELKNKDEAPIVLAKNSSGVWQITEPKPYAADSSNVSSTISSLSSLNSERVVDDKPSDLKQYGLSPAYIEVNITEKDNKSQKLLLGDLTPTGSAVYTMLAGDPRVFTIPSFNKSSIAKSLNDFRDKRLLQVSADQVSRLNLVQKNQTIEFGRTKDGWQILQPRPFRADSSEVGQLVQKLTDARMDLTNPEATKDADKAFASGTPVVTVKVTSPSGTQELQVRKGKDADFAKSSVVSGAYKVNADLAEALNKNLDDFRNKKIFDLGFSDPDKIELHVGSKAVFLVRNGEDWWSNGKKMDADSVHSLVSNFQFIGADKFVDSGFANPTLEATVTSDDGKRVENVAFARTPDGYIAKRGNETALYHVQSSSVDAVQKSFDDLKPAGK